MPRLDEPFSPENRLLVALRAGEYERLRPAFETAHLAYKQVLHEAGASVEYAYFPQGALACLLSVDEKQASVEVGLVGTEGMVGAPMLLGKKNSPYRVVVMQEGPAIRVSTEALKKEFKRRGELRELLLPYAHALLTESAQSAACHRFHTPLERLCRWLLTVQDRALSDEFRATQEFISDMLGTRRATVTEVAHGLQQQGLIDYHRGRVHIRDRESIERLVCRCYYVIKEEYDGLKRA